MESRSDDQELDIEFAYDILISEAQAIQRIADYFDEAKFLEAVLMCRCTQSGSIITSGAGKSGIAAQKIAATFSSLDHPSFFLHPNDAMHGDIGKVQRGDTTILISNSGESSEVVQLAALINKRFNKRCGQRPWIIAITTNHDSSLAKQADVVLETGKIVEAGPTALPTSSIAAVIALGDALAMTTAGRHFSPEQYWANHHGGQIGRRFSKVDDFMRTGDDCPIVNAGVNIQEVLIAITTAGAGAAIVVDDNNAINGIFTDGDLRRFLGTGQPLSSQIDIHMTPNPYHVKTGSLVEDALEIFGRNSIGDLPVIDDKHKPVGMLCLKDLTMR